MINPFKPLAAKISLLYLVGCQRVWAELPTAPTIEGVSASSDSLTYFEALIKKGAFLLSVVLAIAMFIGVGWMIFSDINAARLGKKEWGPAILTAVIGILAIVLVSYLLAKANGIL